MDDQDSVSGSEWHLARGGKKHGPISDNELFRLAEQGNLKPDDLLWKRGFEDWKLASSIPGVLSASPPHEERTEIAPEPVKRQSEELAVGLSNQGGTRHKALLLAIIVVVALVGAQFITIFVIQPIGAVPEGRTLVISRLNTLQFIDSADAWCERQQGGVSLLCRMVVMGRVAREATVLARLPYSAVLYQISTDGKTYER